MYTGGDSHLLSFRNCFLKVYGIYLRFYKETHAQKVDWSGRCSTPAGIAGELRPHRAKPEEA